MRLSIRRTRLDRLYPVKSKPRTRFRCSRSASKAGDGSGAAILWFNIGIGFSSDQGLRFHAALGSAGVRHPSGAQRGADNQCGPTVFVSLSKEPIRSLHASAASESVADRRRQRGTLLEDPERGPQRRLQRIRLFLQQRLGRPGMPDPAAVMKYVSVRQSEQRTAARRIPEARWGAGSPVGLHKCRVEGGFGDLLAFLLGFLLD